MTISQTVSGEVRHGSRHAIRAIAFSLIIGITAISSEAEPVHSSRNPQSTAVAGTITETPLWTEGFEGNWFLDWTVEAGTWEVGGPGSGPGVPFAGSHVAATVLEGNYAGRVDSRLIRTTPFVVPAAAENPRLRFWHWFSFSTYDTGEVQVSADGGTTWNTETLVFLNTGSGVWTRSLIDLSSYAGQEVQIAFDFHAACYYTSCRDVSSGWYIDDVTVVTGPPTFANPEGFEAGLGDWAVQCGTWEVGEVTTGPGSCRTGTGCAATVLAGNYAGRVDSRIISAPFTVPLAVDDPTLLFWHWFSFSTYESGEVQISADGGTTWTTLLGPYVNTSSGVWTQSNTSISTYSGQTVQIAFDFHAACYYTSCRDVSSGWYIDDITVFCGAEACSLSVGTDDNPGVPEQTVLHDNFPNPFGHFTTIRFQLAATSDVRLTVVDLLGRTVRELASGTQPWGRHEVSVDATDLPSGIYFYRLEAGDFVKTKRMVVVR